MTEVSASCALCTVKPETVPEPTVIERTSRKDVPHHLALLTTASQARQRATGARAAQNRRGQTKELIIPSPRRVFRPTDRGFIISPFRRFAGALLRLNLEHSGGML